MEQAELKDIKFFIGPVSKNIVDVVIEYCNSTNNTLGFIPTRRQIDYKNSYVGWDTKEFVNYVRSRTNNVIIERDHSGIGQGQIFDTGTVSQQVDTNNNFDIIHIDPWKVYKEYDGGLFETIENIKYIHSINDKCLFEVGTEEAIRRFEITEFYNFLNDLKNNLGDIFNNVKYAVIQSGTGLLETKNIGKFNKDRLIKMIEICNSFGLLSKEHNGDYLTLEDKKIRFDNGLSAINIAPEFGVFETDILLEHMSSEQQNQFYDICYESGKWKNWVEGEFDPINNRLQLIRICGHYQFNTYKFKKMNINIDNIIKEKLYKKLEEMLIF